MHKIIDVPADIIAQIVSCLNKRPATKSSVIQYMKADDDLFIPVGSYRRRESTHSDIDLLSLIPIADVMAELQKCVNITRVINSGEHKMSVLIDTESFGYNAREKFQIDIFYTTTADLPFALFHYTGNRAFNIRSRRLAKLRGLKLNQYGLYRGNERVPGLNCERDIFEYLNISFKEPWDRMK